MAKRGYYGTNKTGYGLIFLEEMNFDGVEYVIGLGSPSNYPYEHSNFGQRNYLKMGSGFNKVKHTHVAHKDNYIRHKTKESRRERMIIAKEEFEKFGYEVELRFKN